MKGLEISKPSREQLKADYAGHTTDQLAQRYGISQGTVMNWLRSFGIPRHRRGYKAMLPPLKSKLEHLYLASGLSTRKIGEIYGVSNHTVVSWLEAYNIPRYDVTFTNKRNWANPIFRDAQIAMAVKGLARRPTQPEQRVIDVVSSYGLPYKYTGDGSFIVAGLNPDFVNVNGAKIAIEVFGSYWHTKRVKSPIQTEAGRKARFAEYGWDLIILWEDKLKRMSDTEIANRIASEPQRIGKKEVI